MMQADGIANRFLCSVLSWHDNDNLHADPLTALVSRDNDFVCPVSVN